MTITMIDTRMLDPAITTGRHIFDLFDTSLWFDLSEDSTPLPSSTEFAAVVSVSGSCFSDSCSCGHVSSMRASSFFSSGLLSGTPSSRISLSVFSDSTISDLSGFLSTKSSFDSRGSSLSNCSSIIVSSSFLLSGMAFDEEDSSWDPCF
ncbi:unnamed protein product [Linum tenue]|uniref:Uncharacterized protein n=1 Tax=Linum tenue TaxID=586396 RepID=A0AAV0IGK2_9ROSI|nr:unnamed protein product [Linum tenue]